MTPLQIIEALGPLAVGELEQVAASLAPMLPVDSLVNLITNIAGLIESKSRDEQLKAAEATIVSGDDALEAAVATKP